MKKENTIKKYLIVISFAFIGSFFLVVAGQLQQDLYKTNTQFTTVGHSKVLEPLAICRMQESPRQNSQSLLAGF